MTATITRPKPKKSAASRKESPYKRLHVIIPITDMLWASQQKPSVTQLWQECWTADPYGSRWMPFSTEMGYSTFICAKKILSESGLFIFKPDKSIQDGRETASWMVKNLHGSRMKEFWEKADSAKRELDAEKRELDAGDSEKDAGSEEMGALYRASILGQSQLDQAFQKPSRTAQEHLTNSTKEFVRCNSDTLAEISREEQTAHAPLGVASPLSVQGVSEIEVDLPTAMDCTSLTLVDALRGESALLLGENQDCGVEPKGCLEGDYSAAPVTENEFSLSSAIADKTTELGEQGNSVSLPGENQVSGVEVKADHKGESLTVSATNSEKWSHEAIVGRSNARLERIQKLKVAANSLQNPGFEYLLECWDDPALQIVIKKLLVKYPQWGIACVDGVLVDWDE